MATPSPARTTRLLRAALAISIIVLSTSVALPRAGPDDQRNWWQIARDPGPVYTQCHAARLERDAGGACLFVPKLEVSCTEFHLCQNLWMTGGVYAAPFIANLQAQLRQRPWCRECRVVGLDSLVLTSLRACVLWRTSPRGKDPDWLAHASIDPSRPSHAVVYSAGFRYQRYPGGSVHYEFLDRARILRGERGE